MLSNLEGEQDALPRNLLGHADCCHGIARHICNIPKASSAELHENCDDPVVILMPEIDKTTLVGTMRLGIRPTVFQDGSEWSRLRQLYGERKIVNERHRHRYEVHPEYLERLAQGWFRIHWEGRCG
jgi:CTP synthase